MPVIQRETTVGAGVTTQNIFDGSAYEFARTRQVVSIGISAAATGSFVSIQSGADVVAEEFAPAILTRYPIIPDEMYYNDVMEMGDRLRVTVRNPTAGAIVHRAIAQISMVT
jgi:hypothetical protein